MFAAALPIVFGTSIAEAQDPPVVINEFVAANDNGLADNTGAFEDWIELHNTGAAPVDLAGWTYAFAPLAIGPFLGVWAMARLRAHPDSVKIAGGRR